jgi:hypothetical protein
MKAQWSLLTVFLALVFPALGSALAQDAPPSAPQPQTATAPSHESKVHAEFRKEHERFNESCGEFSIPGCAQLLFMDHPLHIAVGSIAPQNGVGFGPAMVLHHDAPKAYYKWNFDAVGTMNGSWRAGVYMKIVPVPDRGVKIGKAKGALFTRPLFTIYAQSITLNKLGFFGLGPATTVTGKSYFGMQQTIAGVHAILPVPKAKKLNLSLVGEMNGRFVDIRSRTGESSPSIEALYTNATAPGLTSQPGFVQFGEGLRIKPALGEYLKLNYSGMFQQFVAPGDSTFSFRRFILDFDHEIPLAKIRMTSPKDGNGPNECGPGSGDLDCPLAVSTKERKAVYNRTGAIDLRFLLTESIASGGSVVPFYFQPTLGGSDVNGTNALPSFQDYRFRAPNLMLLHGSLEHSIWGPFGFTFAADTGKVVRFRDDIAFQHFSHSFATGITLRAGGLPMVYLVYAWGGHEGNHTIANINTSLLGGSNRPSLF